MKHWIEKLKSRPGVAHLIATQGRFGSRLGSQFAAAITYFSVLSMVPIIMFAFAALGLTLTVIRPDLLIQVRDLIQAQFDGNPAGSRVVAIVDKALGEWRSIGIIGLLTVMWSGAGWVANLKSAFRAQIRPDFDLAEDKKNIAVETLINLGILIGLLAAVVTTFAVSSVATALAGLITSWLHLDQIPGGGFLLRAVPILVSLLAGFVLFSFIFRVLPEQRIARATWMKAALAGSIGLAGLQYLATFLFSAFAGNPATSIFGPVIVLMLFFNLFATLILMLAAWMATATPRVEQTPPSAIPPPAQAEDAPDDEPEMVSAAVAGKAMSIGLGTGYVVGAATGVGLGAVIAAAAAWFARIRRR